MDTKTKSEEQLLPRIRFFWTVSRNGCRILGIRDGLSQKGTSGLDIQIFVAYQALSIPTLAEDSWGCPCG
jgi:hypothetical protein